MPEVLPVKVFTREHPATKVDIWNCFTDAKGKFVARAVVEARGIIGLNVPKYLKREDLMDETSHKDVEFYALNADGQEWLLEGLKKHLERHPQDAEKLTTNPFAVKRAAVKRTRK